MARSRKKGDAESLKTDSWEVVIPEINFVPHKM
jgi:hypothetical protein